MAGFCLPVEESKKFLEALKTGVINPEKLIDMTSEERHVFFTELVGERDATHVNALYESKLLTKNVEQGLVSWAKRISGISPEHDRSIIGRLEKMNGANPDAGLKGAVLNPESLDLYLKDFVSERLGTTVNFDEAEQLGKLSRSLQDAEDKIDHSSQLGSPSRLEYGARLVETNNYFNDLKLENQKMSFADRANEFKTNTFGAATRSVSDVAGFAKAMKASLDNSAIFRQGWKTLFTHSDIWAKNALQSFKDIAKQIGRQPSNNEILDGVNAEIFSRPNAIEGVYERMKLDLGSLEEAYPTSLPEKVPVLGRLYKSSEVAYTAFLRRMRADIADRVVNIAKETGGDVTDKVQMRAIGKMVNSLTGRGSLGEFEKVGKSINTIFFSPKMVKSQIDFLTLHAFDKDITPFVRKQAAKNLLKVIAGTAIIMGIAKAIDPKSVELDPRSSDFGKIKVGHTRFDITGGMGSILTLAAREIMQSSKSSTTGNINKLNSGKFGSQTGLDVLESFFENKLSPTSSLLVDTLLRHKDFQGNPITLKGEAVNFLAPLPITNGYELYKDPKAANFFVALIADGLGISTNTYGPTKKKKKKKN